MKYIPRGSKVSKPPNKEIPLIYGKIYRITALETDKCYIGSTEKNLQSRFQRHRLAYNQYLKGSKHYISSFEIVKYQSAKIELLEDFKCLSKKDLRKREGFYQQILNCVNKAIAGRTKKEWYMDNHTEIRAQSNAKTKCECGGCYTRQQKARHFRTKKHRDYLEEISEAETSQDEGATKPDPNEVSPETPEKITT